MGFYEAAKFTEQEACQRKYSLRAFLPGHRVAGHLGIKTTGM